MSDSATMLEYLPLLRAWPHKWGPGQVHQYDTDLDPDCEKTLCGKFLKWCPGDRCSGPVDMITCKVCMSARETRARNAAWEKKYAQERADYEARQSRQSQPALRMQEAEYRAQYETYHQKKQRQWREAYDRYLLSGEWFAKRAKVMQRADGTCEGCGINRAVQVHHLRYPRNCQPGSDEWVAQEKLFDLRAICRECHEDVHRR